MNDQSVNDEAHVMFGGEKASAEIGRLRSSHVLAGSAFSTNIETIREYIKSKKVELAGSIVEG
ncbi:hypothetical protein [Paenibacillus sp. Z3-2]